MEERALQVSVKMVLQRSQPDVITYTVVISPCEKAWLTERPYRPLRGCEGVNPRPL